MPQVCTDATVNIKTSLCECSTHTHPDADVFKAAFDPTRFQHIWRRIHRSFDLFLLSTTKREFHHSQNQLSP